jgi:hypothetical protein
MTPETLTWGSVLLVIPCCGGRLKTSKSTGKAGQDGGDGRGDEQIKSVSYAVSVGRKVGIKTWFPLTNLIGYG